MFQASSAAPKVRDGQLVARCRPREKGAAAVVLTPELRATCISAWGQRLPNRCWRPVSALAHASAEADSLLTAILCRRSTHLYPPAQCGWEDRIWDIPS